MYHNVYYCSIHVLGPSLSVYCCSSGNCKCKYGRYVTGGHAPRYRAVGLHLLLAHTGTGNTHRKQQTRQQALPCNTGISRHHTAAAAAALTRSSRACAAAAANQPNALRCLWTHRQTDRPACLLGFKDCHSARAPTVNYYVFVHSAWKGRPRNDLYCVGWDVKPYSLTNPLMLDPLITECYPLSDHLDSIARSWSSL